MVTIPVLVCMLHAFDARAEVPSIDIEMAKKMALENNPTVAIARESLRQAELLVDKAWASVKPQWSATGTYTHYNTEMAFDVPDFSSISTNPDECGDRWDPTFGFCFTRYDRTTIQRQDSFGFFTQVTQPVFVARTISAIKSAYRARDLARINESNAEEMLLYSVEVAYYGALAARRYTEIAAESVKLRREHLKVAKAKFQLGDAPKISALSAEIQLDQAEQDLKSAEKSLELAKESLRLLCGIKGDFELVQPEEPVLEYRHLGQLLASAMNRRRDIQAALVNLELAQEAKRDAWYRFLPQLVATGSLRVSDVKGFTNEYVTWNVGLALTIPLYDGGLRYAYLKEARSKIRQAEAQLEMAKRKVETEIKQLWLRMEMARANLEKARHSVDLAKEQVELAKASFDAGASTYLEVQDANAALFVSQVNEAQQELNYHLSILRLNRAVTMYTTGGAPSEQAGASQQSEQPGSQAGGQSEPAASRPAGSVSSATPLGF